MPWGGSAGSQVFTRSTGTQTGSTAWQLEDAAGTKVVASKFDTHDQDLADGISACLKKDGNNTAEANLPMGGFKHTSVANASARNQYLSAAQAADGEAMWYGTVAGTDTYTMSDNGLNPTALTDGMPFLGKFTNANTGAATLNVNSIGAVDLVDATGAALIAGHIAAGSVHMMVYNSTTGDIHVISSNNLTVPSSRTLTAGVGLSGGGTLASNRTFDLDVGSLDEETGTLDRADSVAIDDDSAGSSKRLTLDNLSALVAPSVILKHTAAENTEGGGATTNTWTTLDFNTTEHDDGDSLVSLSSGIITLSAGTYVVKFRHVFVNTLESLLRFRDTTAGADRGVSLGVRSNSNNFGIFAEGITAPFTIASNTTYVLQYYCKQAGGSVGLGYNMDIPGYDEEWGQIEIYRVGD